LLDTRTFKGVEGIEKTGSFNPVIRSFNKNRYNTDPLPFHKCTEEDKKKFYKPNIVYAGSFDLVFTELFCITNPEKLVLSGDWDGDVASGLKLSFDECVSKTSNNCLSESEKREFFAKSNVNMATI
jgi:hypothetical protein